MDEIVSEVDGGVLTITINRPDARNTMTYSALDGLYDAIVRAGADPDVRAVIVTGAGKYFCTGTDLSPGAARLESASDGASWRGGVGAKIALAVWSSAKPFIAAINGSAVGIGLTMTLPMDFRIASATARFGIPYVRRGILPESCSSWFLPRVVGMTRATDWALTGRIFDATEAQKAGLLTELLPADQVLERARDVGREIAGQTAAVSSALTRQLLWGQLASDSPMTANRLEIQGIRALLSSADVVEGLAAFREKRDPNFTMKVPDDLPDFFPWLEVPPDDVE